MLCLLSSWIVAIYLGKDLSSISVSERTHAEVLSAAEEAEAEHCAVKGILGVSPLSTLLDVVDAVPIDYMHCCLEGVMRSLMKYWFNSSFQDVAFQKLIQGF